MSKRLRLKKGSSSQEITPEPFPEVRMGVTNYINVALVMFFIHCLIGSLIVQSSHSRKRKLILDESEPSEDEDAGGAEGNAAEGPTEVILVHYCFQYPFKNQPHALLLISVLFNLGIVALICCLSIYRLVEMNKLLAMRRTTSSTQVNWRVSQF